MNNEVRIFDGNGNLKRVISSKEISQRVLEKQEYKVQDVYKMFADGGEVIRGSSLMWWEVLSLPQYRTGASMNKITGDFDRL